VEPEHTQEAEERVLVESQEVQVEDAPVHVMHGYVQLLQVLVTELSNNPETQAQRVEVEVRFSLQVVQAMLLAHELQEYWQLRQLLVVVSK
jgi:hypothetical protein